eukprot:jgi/Astpho2/7639/Aster-x1453
MGLFAREGRMMEPLVKAPGALPFTTNCLDPGVAVIHGNITDPFVGNWLDLLCFLLSRLPADGVIAAAVIYS